jgi:hypothetical protein
VKFLFLSIIMFFISDVVFAKSNIDQVTTNSDSIVNDKKILFSNLAQNGKYRAEWWLCLSGFFFLTDTVFVQNGNLTLEVPPIQWDYVYKISLAGTKVKLEQNFPNP